MVTRNGPDEAEGSQARVSDLKVGDKAQWLDPGARVVHVVASITDALVTMRCGRSYNRWEPGHRRHEPLVGPPKWLDIPCARCDVVQRPATETESEDE